MRTAKQLKLLEALWAEYGNEGPQWTIGNHKLIQRLLFVPDAELDASVTLYDTMMDNDPDKTITDACKDAIRAVLDNP